MDVNKVCQTCTLGKYCLGGDAKINPNNTESDCPGGLQTIFAGAKSQAQCFTKAGYGRTATKQANGQVALSAVQCPVGTYNVGGNTAGCQKCSAGLTTAASSSNSASLCCEYQPAAPGLLPSWHCRPAQTVSQVIEPLILHDGAVTLHACMQVARLCAITGQEQQPGWAAMDGTCFNLAMLTCHVLLLLLLCSGPCW